MADPSDRSAASLKIIGSGGGGSDDRKAKLERVHELHRGRMDAIDTKFGERIATANSELESVNQKWDQIQAEVDRQPRYARALFYWPVMIALMIFEVPVNRLSFELFFQESPTIALGVAFLVGVILVSLSHVLGLLICRFGYFAKRRGWVGEVVKIGLITGIVLFMIYGVSVLRQGYLDFETAPQATLADMISGGASMQVAADLFQSGLKLSGWIFFAINLGIVAVGLTASFFSHDPHPDFQAADIARKAREKELRGMKNQKSDAEAVEKRRHANQVHRVGA